MTNETKDVRHYAMMRCSCGATKEQLLNEEQVSRLMVGANMHEVLSGGDDMEFGKFFLSHQAMGGRVFVGVAHLVAFVHDQQGESPCAILGRN